MLEWAIGTAVVAISLSVISSHFVVKYSDQHPEPHDLKHTAEGMVEALRRDQ